MRHAIVATERELVIEQRQLADQFTRPLADRISTYLQCIFGAGARAAGCSR